MDTVHHGGDTVHHVFGIQPIMLGIQPIKVGIQFIMVRIRPSWGYSPTLLGKYEDRNAHSQKEERDEC